MRSEQLDSYVQVQAQQPGKDSLGQTKINWVTVFECWASILDLSGNQFINSGANKSTVSTSIKVRFDEQMKANYRIKYGTDIYDIEVILRSKDRRWMTLMCKRGVNNG